MGIAHKHHTLPTFYLKRFADHKGLLSKWERTTNTWSPIRPKSASVEVDFYIVNSEEGPSDAIENALSVIEGRAAEVIQMIEAGTWPIPVKRKAQLAEFLSLQRVRGTGFRFSVDRFTDEVADKVYYLEGMARFRRLYSQEHGRPASQEELGAHARTIEKTRRVAMSQNAAIQTMLKMAADDDRLSTYTHRCWSLERANDPFLATADSPLSFWSANTPGFWGEGELIADEITFPLDPHTCLVLRHSDVDEMITDIDLDRVHELNKRSFEHAHGAVFEAPGTEEQLV